jgi:hypothetical protein
LKDPQWTEPEAAVEALLDGLDSADDFGETFLSLDPKDVRVLTRAQLAAALPARRAMFEGSGRPRRVEARQLPLDERHLLVRADWQTERTGLRLQATYLVRRESAGLRILVYLNHHDVLAELRKE